MQDFMWRVARPDLHGYSESKGAASSGALHGMVAMQLMQQSNPGQTIWCAFYGRITVLKRHARAAIVLRPLVQRPSNALADVVGMVVAGTAMAVALVTTWAAQRSSNLYGVLYCMIIIVGYILKDRRA